MPCDHAPLVVPERPAVELWLLSRPGRLRDQIPPHEVALVGEDAVAGNQLGRAAEQLGGEGLGTVDRVRCRHEREHGLEVRGA